MKGDKEIVKALSQCTESKNDIHKCVDCPYFGDFKDCRNNLLISANDLVKRLVRRNERLKKKNKAMAENNGNIS